ncbi:MAG: helix-turn-helix transcriptional regulator [Alphaproteobacteria bacterium]|nr:helix-turn-helix transcriptional regulator [Alphaproteobacteria bacterium]
MNAIRKVNNRGRDDDGRPNPIDGHVGARIKLRRTLLGMSQEKLGEALGLTFQQVQKYERGANRVGASRLFDLSRILDVPVGFFFNDMPEEIEALSPAATAATGYTAPAMVEDPMNRREVLELVRAYDRVPAPVRRRVYELVKAMGEPTDA